MGLAILTLLAAGALLYVDYRREKVEAFLDDPVKQFKYGSTGGDVIAGIPIGSTITGVSLPVDCGWLATAHWMNFRALAAPAE